MRIERSIALKELERLKPSGTLVDVGCGPGYLADAISRSFPELRVTGLDINDDMLKLARRNFPETRAEFRQADAIAIPFADNEIDFVLSTNAFHHWKDPAQSLREFHRVLKPGGQFLVLDPRRDMRRVYYWGAKILQAFMPRDIRRVNGTVGSVWASYTPGEMAELLDASPFKTWKIEHAPVLMFVWGQKDPAGGANPFQG